MYAYMHYANVVRVTLKMERAAKHHAIAADSEGLIYIHTYSPVFFNIAEIGIGPIRYPSVHHSVCGECPSHFSLWLHIVPHSHIE